MLNILLESLLIECAENGSNITNEIAYIYKTLDNNFTTDLQKEIKNNDITIEKLNSNIENILNSESFKEELEDLDIEISSLIF